MLCVFVVGDRKKLVWMQALQSPFFTETLNLLFKLHTKDAEALFGPMIHQPSTPSSPSAVHTLTAAAMANGAANTTASMSVSAQSLNGKDAAGNTVGAATGGTISNTNTSTHAGNSSTHGSSSHGSSSHGAAGTLPKSVRIAHITNRKFELAKRIDMCGSQALGFAVASIRTLTMLAALDLEQPHNHNRSIELLGRSLKVGFYVCFQSMLSTQGDELGMIEDLEMAALWLHLVSVRLVEPPKGPQHATGYTNNSVESPVSAAAFDGASDHSSCYASNHMSEIAIRRDLVSAYVTFLSCV
jgi:hypothetical protein